MDDKVCPLCGKQPKIVFKEKMDWDKMAKGGLMMDGDRPDYIEICEKCHDKIHPKPIQKLYYIKWEDLRAALLKCDICTCRSCINDGDDLKILSTWFLSLNTDRAIEYGRLYRILDNHLNSGKLGGKYIAWSTTRRQLKELLRNKRFPK